MKNNSTIALFITFVLNDGHFVARGEEKKYPFTLIFPEGAPCGIHLKPLTHQMMFFSHFMID